jgi:hypothetical protein
LLSVLRFDPSIINGVDETHNAIEPSATADALACDSTSNEVMTTRFDRVYGLSVAIMGVHEGEDINRHYSAVAALAIAFPSAATQHRDGSSGPDHGQERGRTTAQPRTGPTSKPAQKGRAPERRSPPPTRGTVGRAVPRGEDGAVPRAVPRIGCSCGAHSASCLRWASAKPGAHLYNSQLGPEGGTE